MSTATLSSVVAVKSLSSDVTRNKNRLQRFEREALSVSNLSHPNIVNIYEIGYENEQHFIVAEFIDGESLARRLIREELSIHELLDIGIQIASALSAAHAASIIHRDIKPDNIMIRRDHLVKVIDFGLAKLNESEVSGEEVQTRALRLTTPGVVMGTALYMSPEQARGLRLDARADIWNLGVVLYEMVAGHRPFTGTTMSDVIVEILTMEPLPLVREAPGVPPELERIVMKALRKDEEERYQLAKNLVQDLKAVQKRLEFEAKLERTREGQGSVEGKPIVSSVDDPQTAER